jgi:hypothetical protein
MKLTTNFGIEGTLEIFTSQEGGEKTSVFKHTNLVVTASKEYLIRLLFDLTAYDGKVIDTLKIGTGGTWDPEGFYPKVEDPLQVDVSAPVKAVIVSPVHVPGTTSVTFLADIAQNDNSVNGQILSEAGLFRGNSGSIIGGNLFSIKNYPGIRKTEYFAIHYVWTIKLI